MHLRNLKSMASPPKRSRDPDRASFGGNFLLLPVSWVGLTVVDPLAIFKKRSFIRSRNIEGGLKFLKGSRDPDDAPFTENF